MKNLTMSLTFAVTALAAAAGSASAQSFKAEIPMAFQAGNKTMAPGSYDVRAVTGASGNTLVAVRNRATNATVVAVTVPGTDVSKVWRAAGKPVISFECVDNKCVLRRMWDGLQTATYQFPAWKRSPAETERIAVVTFGLTKAD